MPGAGDSATAGAVFGRHAGKLGRPRVLTDR